MAADFQLRTVLLSTLFFKCSGQFPKVCVSPESLSSKECCPQPVGYDSKCGGPGRGACVDLSPPKADDSSQFGGDLDRLAWPSTFFTRACKCDGNFDGYDCSQCKFGYKGTECDKENRVTRRNILSMSQSEVKKFRSYLLNAKDKISDYQIATSLYIDMLNGDNPLFNNVNEYDRFVWNHYYAARENIRRPAGVNDGSTIIDFAHAGPAFLTWHRAYLLLFERMIQQVNNDDDFAIPYWDWSGAPNCEICTEEYMGENSPSPPHNILGEFSGWKDLCSDFQRFHDIGLICSNVDNSNLPSITRHPGSNKVLDELPSLDALYYTLSMTDYDTRPLVPTLNVSISSHCSFRNILEGFADSERQTGLFAPFGLQSQNRVHSYLNGTMGIVASSPNDPMFWLHHSNVDRIMEKWIRRYNVNTNHYPPKDSTPVGQEADSYMVPFFPVMKNGEFLQKSQVFGYTYDNVDSEGKPISALEKEREDQSIDRMQGCVLSPLDADLQLDLGIPEITAILNLKPWKALKMKNVNKNDGNDVFKTFNHPSADQQHSDGARKPPTGTISVAVVVIVLLIASSAFISIKGRNVYHRYRGYQPIREMDTDKKL
ncbi:tyrosinase-like [Saccoglossus kowalevskii]|uniref:Tyrosinase n=1 Tax=Saccoglossus kowalevskii TaxID=10224 RepID=A0ABM0MAQ4_SACKO|nr:PREDICTED: tyrosinase-like [Saccoglossus kowalevskii]